MNKTNKSYVYLIRTLKITLVIVGKITVKNNPLPFVRKGFNNRGKSLSKTSSQKNQPNLKENVQMTKTSVGNPIVGVEWEYNGTVGMFKGRAYQGGGSSRTLFLNPKPAELKDIPEEMFMVKISQSKDPARAGQPLFRFLTFRASEEDAYTDKVPKGVDQNTPLSEIKELVVGTLGEKEEMQISLRINLHGTFTIIDLADGTYDIYNEDKFPADDVMDRGEPPYYLRNDVPITVKLKGAENLGNDYFQSRLSSTLKADDVFQMRAASKVWGADDSSTGATYDPTGATEAGADEVW